MTDLFKTPFHSQHTNHGAQMVEFGGWEMPIQYPSGIIQEHLTTRRAAGLFDVSHMGRFLISGDDALSFLQFILTNNAAALEIGESQYTLIQNDTGGALDDAYLYRFFNDTFLLVVNASNRTKDWDHLLDHSKKYGALEITDATFDMAMLSLQGPHSKDILQEVITDGELPLPMRNSLSIVTLRNIEVLIARTGYTGEPIGFELFFTGEAAQEIWKILIKNEATPIGLGARDTLRLEAGMPLYGHELGIDKEGEEIPLLASRLSRFALSFSPLKAEFYGKEKLLQQYSCLKRIIHQDFSNNQALPKMIFTVAVTGKGIAREGYKVYKDDRQVGYITSGTMVPYYLSDGEGMDSKFSTEIQKRSICQAYLESSIQVADLLEIEIRNKRTGALVVPYHMSAEAPPFVRPIHYSNLKIDSSTPSSTKIHQDVTTLLQKSISNTVWRQNQCINLIPSEQSQSTLARLLSITDACGRYAEHKEVKAFSHADVFYYQGVDFIREVEDTLNAEMCKYFHCSQVESRLISGQMANTAVFSAMVDFLNRADRKVEPKRISRVLNHHIISGGHLSAQPMGALRDYIARDSRTEKPAVIHFPVLPDNPFKIDITSCRPLFEEYQPELIILGKSMILHKEPIQEMRALIDECSPGSILMYDMAHVLGLCGPHFQDPIEEGADIITGSTHKTFFGSQRGIVVSDFTEDSPKYLLWEALQRRAFPGSVSNHHLGTMLGLLMATYEMNHFRDEYQKNIIANAKAFAEALNATGLDVAGDPEISFTETHQVIINVGYAQGYDIAKRLENSNIIVNYQATPAEEGFTAAGALRTGVSEMTRFGMQVADFQELAQMFHDVIINNLNVKEQVIAFRKKFTTMLYCFDEKDYSEHIQKLHNIL